MLKISSVLALAMLVSGCATSPPRQGATAPAATQARPAATAAAPASATPAAPATTTVTAQPAKRLKNGFTLVIKNGVATYCRQDLQTGSHIVVQQRCLSQHEYDSLEDDTRRDVDQVRRTISPAMGTVGGGSH